MKTILLALIALLFGLRLLTRGQESNRYLVIRGSYDFAYLEALPYEAIRDMQWNTETGFSEITETPTRLYYIVDFENRSHGVVLQDRASDDCFALWLYPDLGADNMPHVSLAEWVTCDAS